MMQELLQFFINLYAQPFLYLFALWYLVVGFIGQVGVVAWLTKLPLPGIMLSTAMSHIRAVMLSFVCAPAVTTLSIMFLTNRHMAIYHLAIWFIFLMPSVSAYYFCESFATVKCHVMRNSLLFVSLLVGVSGLLILQLFSQTELI